MDNEKSELHVLFEKLDALARGERWRLERRGGSGDVVDKRPRRWVVTVQYHEGEGATPEEAARAALAKALDTAGRKVQQYEDSAKDARDHFAEMRRLAGG